MQKWMVEFIWKSKGCGNKIVELAQFASPNLLIYLILYGVGVCCDRGLLSVHSQFIEKSMHECMSSSLSIPILIGMCFCVLRKQQKNLGKIKKGQQETLKCVIIFFLECVCVCTLSAHT